MTEGHDPLRSMLLGARWKRAAPVRVRWVAERLEASAETSVGERRLEPVEAEILGALGGSFRVAELHSELVTRGAPVPIDTLLEMLRRLAAEGAIVPDDADPRGWLGDPVRRGVAALGRPRVYVPSLLALLFVTLARFPVIRGRAHALLEVPTGWEGATVSPYVLLGTGVVAALVTAYARQVFRLMIAGADVSSSRLNLAMKGLIPVLHSAQAGTGEGKGARFVRATSGFAFDLLMIQIWAAAAAFGDFVWRSVASIELAVCLALCAMALNPLAEYDANRALGQLLGVANLRVASAEALGRVARRRRRPGDLGLAAYRVMGWGYMLLVTGVLVRLVAAFLRRAWYMRAQRGDAIAVAVVGAVWIAYLARRAWLGRRASAAPPAPERAKLTLEAHVEMAPDRARIDDLTFVRDDGRGALGVSSLAPRVALFAYDGPAALPPPPLDAARGDEASDRLSLAVFRSPASLLSARQRAQLELVRRLAEAGRGPATHDLAVDVAVVRGHHNTGFADFSARSDVLTLRGFIGRLQPTAAPPLGRVVERAAVVARGRASGAVDAVVLEGPATPERVARLAAALGVTTAPAPDVAYVQAKLRDDVRPGEREYLARARGIPVDVQRAYGLLPLVLRRDAARFDARFLEAATALGLFSPPATPDAPHEQTLDGPAVLVPVGRRDRPVGFKARWLDRGLRFGGAPRRTAGWRRYGELLPLDPPGPAPTGLDALRGWVEVPEEADSVCVLEGELKAMAHHRFFGGAVVGLGGLEMQWLESFVEGLGALPRRPIRLLVCFDAEPAPAVTRPRADHLTDGAFRGLELALMARDRAAADVAWVPGLHDGREKIDLDQVLGLAPAERDRLRDAHEARMRAAIPLDTLLREAPPLEEYLRESVDFAGALRGALDRAATAGPRGSDVLGEEIGALFARARRVHRLAGAVGAVEGLARRLAGDPV